MVKPIGEISGFRAPAGPRGPFVIVAASRDVRRPARPRGPGPRRPREDPLATKKELSDFLASVERRAFKQCVFSVQDDDAALDIVQDAMLKLAENYSARPREELPLLFQRILQNAIRDHFRRGRVRSAWTSLWSSLGLTGEDDEADPL